MARQSQASSSTLASSPNPTLKPKPISNPHPRTASGFRGVYRNEHTRHPSKPWEAFLPMQRTAPAGSIHNPHGLRPEVVYSQRSLGLFATPIEAARAP